MRILNLFVIGTGLGFCVVAFLLFGHAETNPIGLSFGTAFILLIAGIIVAMLAFLLGPTICGTSNLIRLGHQEGFFLTCYMIFLAVLSTESFTICHLYLSRQLPPVLQDDLDATLSGWNTATLTTATVFLVIIPLISMALSLVHKIKVYFLQLQDTLVISHLSWSQAAANHRANNIRKFQPYADPEFAASLDFDSEDEVDEIIEKYFLKTDIDENPSNEVSEWLDAAEKYTKTNTPTKKGTVSTSSRAAVAPVISPCRL